MGGSCSSVENAKLDEQRQASITNLKKANTKVPEKSMDKIIKNLSEFENYVRGSKAAADDKVCAAAKMHDENAEDLHECYVVREVEKGAMPVKDISLLSEHLLKLSKLDHMHICRFVEAFDTDKTMQLVYERGSSASIFDEDPKLKKGAPLDAQKAQTYCRQICMALSVAHKGGIVHGRLNDRSLLLDKWAPPDGETLEDRYIKICDLGQTWFLREPREVRRTSAKLHFEAPENLWQELQSPKGPSSQSEQKLQSSCDMWSFGIIAFRMLTGKLPFPDVDSIKTCTVSFGPEWDKMPDAREMVQGLLKKSGRIRITADRVLRMPWLAVDRPPVSRSKMMRVLNNVIQNCGEITFKKFVMRVIAEDVSPEKLEIVENAFRFIDKNGDGSLEVDEIKAVLRKFLKEEDSVVDAAHDIFEAIDRDASGSLNFAEFTAVSIGPQEYCDKTALWECFNRFDLDGNGEFDKTEIGVVLKQVEHLAESTQVDDVVETIAQDVPLPMDFDTFVQVMITPNGQPVNNSQARWDSLCYSVLKVDNHKVRHIVPRCREEDGYNNQLERKMKSTFTNSGGQKGNRKSKGG